MKNNESTFEKIPGWLNPFGSTTKVSITDQSKYLDTVKEMAKAKQEDAKALASYHHTIGTADNNRFKALSFANVIGGATLLGFLFFACLAIKSSPANILTDPEDKYFAFLSDFIWKALIAVGVLSGLYWSVGNVIRFPSSNSITFFNQVPCIEEMPSESNAPSPGMHLKND